MENNYVFLLCGDEGNYKIDLGTTNDTIALSVVEGMVDSLVDLLKSYSIGDEEILDTIKSDCGLDISL